MRKFYLLCTLVLAMLLGGTSYAQDYSNKGKDFWISYPEHINGTGSIMGLYLTSDVNTTGSIYDNGTLIPFTVTANTITVVFLGSVAGCLGPNSYIHLGNLQDGIKTGAGVHVISALPIVVYAHIINSARSGATLVLPTNVWGKEYIVPSYANSGGNGGGQGFGELTIMASEPNTQVEITPSITTRNGARPAGIPYTITLLNPGDVYQVQFPQSTDLSGTKIKSVAAGGGGCQPIAVVSASTWSAINCGNGNGGDNFYQQLFPTGTWGKQFFTTPLKKIPTNLNDHNPDIVRVFVKDPTTVVTKTENGLVSILSGLTAQGFYEYETEFPTFIQADKPIEVFEYIKTQMCNAPGSPQTQSDPEMIALSSVEQTINDITVYSANNTVVPGGNSAVNVHYINVIMKTLNTGTFTINGAPPGSAWLVIPFTPYSYLKQNINPGTPVSRLKADSAFSAYAYGFGQYESYGYNAGTNVKDLTQQLELETQYGNETSPTVCIYSDFRFKIYFPDSTLTTPGIEIRFDSLKWDMSNRLMINPNNFPVVQKPPTIDSTNIRFGRKVNWYSLPGTYSFNASGYDTLIVTAYRSTNEGCGTAQEYEFPIRIFDPPPPDFTFTTNGCVTQPVQFNETTPQVPRPTYRFWWDFGDPSSGPANNSLLRNPTHLFSGPGTYTVSYVGITTPGCLLDTVRHQVTVNDAPVADFAITGPFCVNDPVSFIDNSIPGPSATINKWTWDFGDGSPQVIVFAPNPPNQVHSYSAPGTYPATLQVETATGCPSTVFTRQIVIGPNGTINLSSAPGTDNQTVCINTPITNITYLVGGGVTGGAVSGLPAGVTGTFAGGVITITGTPTVSGVFNYSITTTGACVNPTGSGTITVNTDGTLALTSAAGTDNQTVCINTPIVAITYAVGGSGTGGSVSGLPAGVNGFFAGGVITISGTPSVSGTFNYTVNTTGPCVVPTAMGTITVTADGIITLTSAPGTNNQTVCINAPIINITYAVGGTGTGGSVSGLPAGVTGTFAGGVITITGTPTVSGTFNYTVTTTGPCATPGANGTITVTADGTIALTSAAGTDNQTVCINTPIMAITYAVGGSGTGGSVSGLPAGVTGTFAFGVITISGSPSVSGVFNYTVNTTGPCVVPTATGRITVTANATLTLTSAPGTNNQTVCINAAINNITYAVGGTGTGGSVSGLPAGVTGSFAAGIITITGTPTVSGVFNYTVTTTGPCVTPSANGTITVTADGTVNLSSAPGTDNQTVCINTPIVNIIYTVGGSGTGGSVTGLPAGVTGTFAFGIITISGSPSVSGVFNYTVNTTGPCVVPTATGRITVTADGTLTLTSAPGTNNQTVCINIPIITITYAVGGTGTGGSVTGLPAGVTGTFAGGVITISGTPSVSGTFNYTVSTTGPCFNPGATGTIIVTPNGTITLTSGAGTDNQNACINNPIIPITYAVGGSGTGGSVVGLPAGVTGTFAFGIITISGSPTVSGIFNYTVTTTGPCVTPTATGTIDVTSVATITLTSAPGTNNQTVCINTPITTITYLVGGSGTGGSVIGLPAGVTGSFAAGIITISGSPTVFGTFNYTVNTTGPCGTPSANGTITVNDNSTLALSSPPGSNVQTVCINTAISNIVYSIGGGGTGASITAGSLPAGVSGSYSGGVFTITGTPTVSGVFNYTITTTGSCINPNSTGTITVTADATLTLTSAPGTTNQTVCINTPIVNITYAVGGSGTGGSVSGLPAGVTGTYAGGVITITGTPSAPGTFNYAVTTTGPCVKPSTNGTIIVNDNSTLTLSSAPGSNVQTVCINTAISNITYAVAGGGTGASITAGSLPAGVSGSYSGGVFTITGTPTVSGTFNFTVGTSGPCVNTSQSGTITVTADATLTLTSAPATTNQTVCINTAISNITYAVGGTGTGGSVSGLPAGVTGNFAGGVITISGTPIAVGTFSYTVNTTGPCVRPSATGTITVNDNSTMSLSSAPGSNVQTVCINTGINNITYAVGGGGTGASITAGSLPAGVSGSYSGGVFTISGTPTASGTFNFTVGTSGPCINTLQSGTITVTPDGTLALTSAPGSDVQTVCVNTAIANIRYAIGGSGTGASITAGSLPAGVNGVYGGGVFTISGTPTASGTFNFTVGNSGPCVNPALTGTLTINPDHTISLSSAASTTNQTVCSNRPIAPIAYTLSGGASGATVSGLPPGVTSSVSGSTLTISGAPASAGSFNYSVITTGNSCITASRSGSITVLQTPAVQFDPVAGVCAIVPSFQVIASPALGIFSGPGINAAGIFNPATAGSGDHIIRYTFTAANGCTNFKEQTLSVFPMPPTNAGPDKFMLEGGQVTLTPALNASMPVTYSWTPNFHLSDPNIAYTIASPPYDFTYTLTVTTDKGCARSDDVFVKVLKKVEIPNIFSPNGDGIHDTWVIQYLDTYPGSTVDIFNRYGQKIFHSEGYTKAWDGTINGNPVPVGTYYYIIDPKNGRTLMSGYVDVIR